MATKTTNVIARVEPDIKEQAEKILLDAFEEAILSLEEFPERIALTSEEPWHSEKIHQLIVENYYVYF